jgi:very-short-patch-repair endonuclease
MYRKLRPSQYVKQHETFLLMNKTEAETVLYPYFKAFELETSLTFHFQHVTVNKAGKHCILDYYFPAVFLAVEVDGEYHEADEQTVKDKAREKILQDLGISTLRISNAEVLENPLKSAISILSEVFKRMRPHPQKRISKILDNLSILEFLETAYKKYPSTKLQPKDLTKSKVHRKAKVPYSPYASGVVSSRVYDTVAKKFLD